VPQQNQFWEARTSLPRHKKQENHDMLKSRTLIALCKTVFLPGKGKIIDLFRNQTANSKLQIPAIRLKWRPKRFLRFLMWGSY